MIAPPPAEVDHLRRLLLPGVRLVALDPAQVDVAVPRPAALGVRLRPAESALMPRGDPSRGRQFAAGRLCARAALREIGARGGPLLIRSDGSPDWAPDVRGSISHKPRLCVAAVGVAAVAGGLGIDLEPARELPPAVWRRVLTDAEQVRIAAGRVRHGGLEPRLIFSAKESYYKWYRSAGGLRDVGFHDVDVDFAADRIEYRPREPLPVPAGRCVVGSNWLITAAWSEPSCEG